MDVIRDFAYDLSMHGEKVKDWMQRNSIKLDELRARMWASYRMSSSTVSRALGGKKKVNPGTIQAFSKTTGIPERELAWVEELAPESRVACG